MSNVNDYITLAKFIGPLSAALVVALVVVLRAFLKGNVIPKVTHETIIGLKDGIISEKDSKITVLEGIVQEQRMALANTLRVAEETAALRAAARP